MAEGVSFFAAELIIETLGSAAVKEIGSVLGVGYELEKLRSTLSAIKAVLLDAEKKRERNNQLNHWLERLEDVVSEADDLLDQVAAEALLRRRGRGATTVRAFFSSSNQLVFRRKTAKSIKRVRETLDGIALDSTRFCLEVSSEGPELATRVRVRESCSYVVDEDVVGRDGDKMAILELLLSTRNATYGDDRESLSVIPIVGMGGLGKTTLAQLVFNDEMVQRHFDLKLWVCVSDNFDERLLIEKIVESLTEMRVGDYTMENLKNILRERLRGNRYLLVLDDVWNENHEKWQGLKRLLSNGDESRVLVTTRSMMVAKIMGTVNPYYLRILDPDKSWSLFKRIAFVHENEKSINSEIAGIAREIVKKCGGVPLAINMIGSLLYFRGQEVEYWRYFRRDLSNIIPQEENNIFKTLKLSYDYLPPHLKHCFAFCGLFAKDQEIDVGTLVFLWIAQGFVKSLGRSQSLEEIGYEYFMELFWRSFFQEVERDSMFNNIKTCKMHDLVHDLAVQVSGKSYLASPFNEEQVHSKLRHLSLSSYEVPSSLLVAKRLRTILFPVRKSWKVKEIFGEAICEVIFTNFTFLRMLDLSNFGIQTVPNSIGKLKHLRYLDLSKNNKIEKFPTSITKLVNLQTLKMNECSKLCELPMDINYLVNLRHLEFYCWKNNVSHMPKGLSKLTNLQTLSTFVLSEDSAHTPCGGKLDELMQLNNLRGKLEIKGLRSGTETEGANLRGKENLRSLSLEWSCFDSDNTNNHGKEKKLDGLQPHLNLKELSIVKYDGIRLSNWLHSLTNLVHLQLNQCSKCELLPSLDLLCSLKKMRFDRCDELKYIAKNHFSSSSPVPTLPSLQELELYELYNFQGWCDMLETAETYEPHVNRNTEVFPTYFPSLTKLTIRDCTNLTSMPLYPNVKELQLTNANEKPFELTVSMSSMPWWSASFSPLSQVKHLIIHFRHNETGLQHFPHWMKGLSSLESLDIKFYLDLDYLWSSFEFHTSRLIWKMDDREYHNCEMSDTSWPTWECFAGLHHLYCQGLLTMKWLFPAIKYLTALQKLQIQDCGELEFSSNDAFSCESNKSLHTVVFFLVSEPMALPSWLRSISGLTELQLGYCYNLAIIPDWICELDSLERLEIIACAKIKSLPESISRMTSLCSLLIQGCPTLLERCRNPTGQDWPKIKHIAEIELKFS